MSRFFANRKLTFATVGIVTALLVSEPLLATDDDEPSATEAQNASQRFEFIPGRAEFPGSSQASLGFRYTQVIASHHQVTGVAPVIDANTKDDQGFGIGDLAIAYNYTPKRIISANPWVPSDVGTGFGVSIPTGDLEDGTGIGSWLLAPRLGFVARISKHAGVTPTLQYLYSLREQDGAADVRTWRIAVPVTIVTARTLWLQWTPAYSRATAQDEDGFANGFVLGKLFKRYFAMSIQYTRGSVFALVPGLVETDHAEQWALGFHVPFGYRGP